MVTFFPLGIMKKFILICLCNAALLLALCLPAQARIVVGLTTVAPLTRIDQTTLNKLSKELAVSAGAEVKIRSFNNDVAITNWLLRFQEIDAAIVSPEYIRQQPAGTLKHLVDLHTNNSSSAPLALVVRSNQSSDKLNQAKAAFLKIGASGQGQKLLGQLGVAGVTLPGETLKRKTVPAPVQPVMEKPLPKAKPKQPAIATQPQDKVTVSPKKPAEKPLVAVAPVVTKKPPSKEKAAPAKTAPKTETKVEAKAETKTTAEISTKTAGKPVPATDKPIEQKETRTEVKPEKPAKQPKVKKLGKPVEKPEPKPASNKRLILFVSMVLLLIILLKICLFVMRWQNKRKSGFQPEKTPALEHEEVTASSPSSTLTPAPTIAPDIASTDEALVIEAGQLGSGIVPALLKRCADLPRPVVLQVTKGSSEKLVYFAGGQVSGALTQNSTTEESGVRWDKLGSLLVREELITREERDQGMTLLRDEPELRFGEALLKLGLIDLSGLRHALTRQAKVTIYSLILFPEGRYQVFAGDGSLPPEESVSLEVTSLIREASHHQTEWTAIRQALPNLNTALNFSEDGRSKLENVSLSPQQEATLSLIDGKSTINDICIGSSMMDYEVYRFLYLMVKAGVLE